MTTSSGLVYIAAPRSSGAGGTGRDPVRAAKARPRTGPGAPRAYGLVLEHQERYAVEHGVEHVAAWAQGLGPVTALPHRPLRRWDLAPT